MATGAVVATLILATAYILGAQALAITASGIRISLDATAVTVGSMFVGRAPFYVTQVVGVFGWLDTPAPIAVVLFIGTAVVALVWISYATSTRHHAVVMTGVLIAALVIPVAIDIKNALQIHSDVWQSRYAMPLYVGVPLVAAVVAGRSKSVSRRAGLRIGVACSVIVAASEFACFFMALHRYAVGVDGEISLRLSSPHSWAPPVSSAACILLGFSAATVYGLWLIHLVRLDAGKTESGADSLVVNEAPKPEPRAAVDRVEWVDL